MLKQSDIPHLLSCSIRIGEVSRIASCASGCPAMLELILNLVNSPDALTGRNALWCLTHCRTSGRAWLQNKQNQLIDMLLNEQHTGRKRMLLQLLRNQSYCKDSLRADFLDFCLSKINSECEPYAIRAFSIYCAYEMSRLYPELLAELELHLSGPDCQSLSPGLLSALKTTRRMIARGRKLTACKRTPLQKNSYLCAESDGETSPAPDQTLT